MERFRDLQEKDMIKGAGGGKRRRRQKGLFDAGGKVFRQVPIDAACRIVIFQEKKGEEKGRETPRPQKRLKVGTTSEPGEKRKRSKDPAGGGKCGGNRLVGTN